MTVGSEIHSAPCRYAPVVYRIGPKNRPVLPLLDTESSDMDYRLGTG